MNIIDGEENQLQDLTIEKLRTFVGFESTSDEEAENIIQTIKQFTIIAYNSYRKNIEQEKMMNNYRTAV
jgi:hypothetical protein